MTKYLMETREGGLFWSTVSEEIQSITAENLVQYLSRRELVPKLQPSIQRSTVSQHSTASQGPNAETHELGGDISHSNCNSCAEKGQRNRMSK